jgi:transcriptional regulator with XRE-family HTH domain
VKTLREWRAERLLSTRALAALAGVSNKTIVQLEAGRQLPVFRTMRRLSEALGVAPGEIAEFAAAIATRGSASPPATGGDDGDEAVLPGTAGPS